MLQTGRSLPMGATARVLDLRDGMNRAARALCFVLCGLTACTCQESPPVSAAPPPVDACIAVDWIAQHHGAISSLDAQVIHTFVGRDATPHEALTRLALDRSGHLLWEGDAGGMRGTEGEMVGHGEAVVGEGDDLIRRPMPVPAALWMLVDGERARDFSCVPARDAAPVAGQFVVDLSRDRLDGGEERARVHVIAKEGPLRGRVLRVELRGTWWTHTFAFSTSQTTVNPDLPAELFVYDAGPDAIDRTAEHAPP